MSNAIYHIDTGDLVEIIDAPPEIAIREAWTKYAKENNLNEKISLVTTMYGHNMGCLWVRKQFNK